MYLYIRELIIYFISMNTITKRSLGALIASSAIIGSFALAVPAFAAESVGTRPVGIHANEQKSRPMVNGTVTTISGNTLTVTMRGWQRENKTTPTSVVYTVDATNAVVTKGGATSTVSAILVGDTVMIKGTVTGTHVVATTIRDGAMRNLEKMPEGKPDKNLHTPLTLPVGNGQPVVGGTVTAISGNSVTIVNKSNVTYTIDVTAAKVTKRDVATATLSSITVGDSVIVQGSVNGTSVTASTVIDQGVLHTSTSVGEMPERKGGFMNSVGGFFSHLFGFF